MGGVGDKPTNFDDWVLKQQQSSDRFAGMGAMGPAAVVGVTDPLYSGAGIPKVTLANDSRISVQPVSFPFGSNLQPNQQVLLTRSALGWHITEILATAQSFPSQIPLLPYMPSRWINYADASAFANSRSANGFEYGRPKISRTAAGFVAMSGLVYDTILSGTPLPTGYVFMTLPKPFWPLQEKRQVIWTGGGQIGVIVSVTGVVSLASAALATGNAISFNRLKWQTDPNMVWTNLTPASPWSNFGGSSAIARSGIDSVGHGFMEGLVKGGVATGSIAVTLPSGQRWNGISSPVNGSLQMVYELSNTSSVWGRLDSPTAGDLSGAVEPMTPASSTGRSLDIDWLPSSSGLAYQTMQFGPNGSQYTAGANWNTPGAIKFADGSVHLKGLLAVSALGVVAYLPEGFRPAGVEIWAVDGTDAPARVDVFPDGGIHMTAGSGTFLELESLSFIPEL